MTGHDHELEMDDDPELSAILLAEQLGGRLAAQRWAQQLLDALHDLEARRALHLGVTTVRRHLATELTAQARAIGLDLPESPHLPNPPPNPPEPE